jgi:hypothetical protein
MRVATVANPLQILHIDTTPQNDQCVADTCEALPDAEGGTRWLDLAATITMLARQRSTVQRCPARGLY